MKVCRRCESRAASGVAHAIASALAVGELHIGQVSDRYSATKRDGLIEVRFIATEAPEGFHCTHEGIGLPGCTICDPEAREAAG